METVIWKAQESQSNLEEKGLAKTTTKIITSFYSFLIQNGKSLSRNPAKLIFFLITLQGRRRCRHRCEYGLSKRLFCQSKTQDTFS